MAYNYRSNPFAIPPTMTPTPTGPGFGRHTAANGDLAKHNLRLWIPTMQRHGEINGYIIYIIYIYI